MEITIRQATVDDLQAISEMTYKIDRFYQTDLHLFEDVVLPPIEKYKQEHIQDLAKQNYIYYVACVDTKIVGYVIGHIEFDIYKGEHGVAEEIFIEEEFRNLGISKLLLEKRDEYFKTKTVKTIVTQIFNTNTRSLDIHYKNGYKFESDIITLVKSLN